MADRRISLASSEDTLEVHEAMKEAATITAFQNSHWTIREAARLCMPWNASFAAIEGFLISNKWMEKDVGTGQQATKLLSDFTDHVFSLNAEVRVDLLVHKEGRRCHTLQKQAAVLRSEQHQAAGGRQEEGAVWRTAAAEGEAGDPQVRCRRRPQQHL